jgi:hypothetical protein
MTISTVPLTMVHAVSPTGQQTVVPDIRTDKRTCDGTIRVCVPGWVMIDLNDSPNHPSFPTACTPRGRRLQGVRSPSRPIHPCLHQPVHICRRQAPAALYCLDALSASKKINNAQSLKAIRCSRRTCIGYSSRPQTRDRTDTRHNVRQKSCVFLRM